MYKVIKTYYKLWLYGFDNPRKKWPDLVEKNLKVAGRVGNSAYYEILLILSVTGDCESRCQSLKRSWSG